MVTSDIEVLRFAFFLSQPKLGANKSSCESAVARYESLLFKSQIEAYSVLCLRYLSQDTYQLKKISSEIQAG